VEFDAAMNDENYFFETDDISVQKQFFVVICYDIENNKRRNRFAKFLEHYAVRVQRSVFEAKLNQKTYNSLLSGINKFTHSDDNIRLYKIQSNKAVKNWGKDTGLKIDEIIII
jgi:CRISPR-associated protein Cas2